MVKKNLVIKRSQLENAGKGLFTKVLIPKGTDIVEYTGKVTTWKEAKHQDNGYIYYVTRNHVIDARATPRALARYANDARGLVRQPGLLNNAEYTEKNNKVFITATKDILPGQEIFVSYGKEYWDAIRFNLKLAAKEKSGK
jgi:SET domain-containing protein